MVSKNSLLGTLQRCPLSEYTLGSVYTDCCRMPFLVSCHTSKTFTVCIFFYCKKILAKFIKFVHSQKLIRPKYNFFKKVKIITGKYSYAYGKCHYKQFLLCISATMNFKVLKPIMLFLYTTWHDDSSSVYLCRQSRTKNRYEKNYQADLFCGSFLTIQLLIYLNIYLFITYLFIYFLFN